MQKIRKDNHMNTERQQFYREGMLKPDQKIRCDAVVFDVDSTLVDIEGLDWLAHNKGCAREVVSLTKKSMDGIMDFHEAMVQKMHILAPTHDDLIGMGQAYCDHLVPGAVEVIEALKHMGIEVWLMSGNYRPAVAILADRLGIDPDKILCNTVAFDINGKYIGFDKDNALAKNGGKAEKIYDVLRGADKRIVFVGDSATDLDVKGHVALFVGFGGVVARDVVKTQADYYIAEKNLLPLLNIIDPPDHVTPPARHKAQPVSRLNFSWKRMGGLYM